MGWYYFEKIAPLIRDYFVRDRLLILKLCEGRVAIRRGGFKVGCLPKGVFIEILKYA